MLYTQLRSFHAVAREGGFTAAANSLGIGQPTVTTQIKTLETHFEVELFHRQGRGITLTETGKELYQHTRRLFQCETDTLDFLSAGRELKTGHLHVGAVGPYHVTEMLAAFNKLYPGVKVSVTIGNSQDMLDALLSFRVDVAVLAQPQDDPRFFAMTYRDHPVIAMVNRAHPWAKRKSVRMENFEGQKMIFREEGSTTRSAFETALNAAGVTPKVVMEIGSREGIWGAVVRGIGISVVSEAELVPHEKIHTLRITGADIVTSAHVVCMAERQKSRLIGAFLGVAHDLSASGKGKRRKRMVL